MRKAIALAGILTFTAMPKVAISDHLAPKISELKPSGNLAHTKWMFPVFEGAKLNNSDLSGAVFIGARMRGADVSGANISGA